MFTSRKGNIMGDTVAWQALATTFEDTANALTPKVNAAVAGSDEQQAILNQQGTLRLAAQRLIGGSVDGVIASTAGLTNTLTQATTAAPKATEVIADIASAAKLLGGLVTLATAFVGATTNPGAVLTAAQGVITAAGPFPHEGG
jgi:hypothetical protein